LGKTVLTVVGVIAAVAIAVAAPYLAPLALGVLGITATATAIAIATAVITIGLSLAVSFAFRALGVGAPSAKNSVGPPMVFRQSISNSFIVYGKRRVGGLLTFFHAKQDTGGAHLRYFVIAVAGHQCKDVVSWMLNDEIVTVDGSNKVTSGKYANAAWLWFQRGQASETANATFVSECDGKWDSSHKGNGVAAIYAKFQLTDDVVSAGMPNITAIIEGRDGVLDTRTSTAGYTRNAALIFYDWLQMAREEGGFGAFADEIPDNTWVNAQANVCDETVNGGVRYAIDAVIQTGAAPSEIRDVMVVNQAGTYSYSGGKHLMRPGYWVAPAATLAETDLAGPIQVSPFLTSDAAANEVTGTYISSSDNYNAAPLSTWDAPGATDIKQLDVDLAFVTNKDQGDRIIRIMGKRAQCEKTVTWPENIVGLKRRAMDTVQVDKTDYGLNNYAWIISSWQFAADFGAVMSLREENSDIYVDEAPIAPTTPPTVSDGSDVLTGEQLTTILRNSFARGLHLTATDTGTNVDIKFEGGAVGSGDPFLVDFGTTPPTEISVAAQTLHGKAYATTYYAFADVDRLTNGTPDDATTWLVTLGLTTTYGSALNQLAFPLRVSLNQQITTPASGGGAGTTTGGGPSGGGYGGGGSSGTQIP
jgi:uncharacterized membrane protein YgcG